ncbi:MAG: putative hydrolase of the superfamily [Gaiellales bacterium]|jgi:putative hydrolase of the HAD superfamily|nr:putative hydrolase of the superfamily [Gaiellales bacterium]
MPRYDAVLLDAYGTLIELDRPFERLRSAVAKRLGEEISPQDARRAFTAEISHYVANCHRARDAATLREVRLECAGIVLEELGLGYPAQDALVVLADALRFRPFDDVEPALAAIRERGLATAVVSNWDCSLPEALDHVGLRFDAVVDSATAGTPKPDPAMFRLAVQRLGVDPARVLHVGDRDDTDGEGARAAGLDVVIVDRSESPAPGTIASLTDLPGILDE